jgi:mRNA interferase MazF
VTRGELFLVRKPGSHDPKRQRVFVVVGRQALIASKFSTVTCAPVYSRHDGLSTQIAVGPDEGLKKESSIHCDELVSLPRSALTHYVGRLGESRLTELRRALQIALDLE